MSVNTNHKINNGICHVEIPVLDLKKAGEFYKTVFDWKINFDMLPDYGLVIEKDVSIGLSKVDAIEYPHTHLYIQIEDIDKTLTIVENEGGKVVSAKNLISDQIGFGATFEDCFGNIMGLFVPT